MEVRIILFFALIGMLSCNEIKECELDENRKFANIEFYYAGSELPIDSLIFDEIYSPASPYISLQDTFLGGFGLPLDPAIDLTEYIFKTDSGEYNLSFTYQREFSVYSVDCDPSVKFYDLTCTSLSFDSIAVINPILNRDELTNVEVYF
ncbi:MAG: DUF6452 family protein [Bacteroidota bacterium]